MPELPEVEHLRRSLEPALLGAKILRAAVLRDDMVHPGEPNSRGAEERPSRSPSMTAGLLRGDSIDRLERRGKQLAIIGRSGRVVCIHLGMSGQLRHVDGGRRIEPNSHIHVRWWLERSAGEKGRLIFRDPRRFGGVWTYPDRSALEAHRWSRLGPDALSVSRGELVSALGGTSRPVKAALLDQALIAGLGNIYVDDALFRSGVHPATPADALDPRQVAELQRSIRVILRRAIKAGGTTLRDYTDGSGRAGRFAVDHAVYGRAGRPCLQCGSVLIRSLIGQRTTVNCPSCQPPALAGTTGQNHGANPPVTHDPDEQSTNHVRRSAGRRVGRSSGSLPTPYRK